MPSYRVSTRLYPRPRINGFEILGPVFTTFKPGTFLANTSMILLSADCSIFFDDTIDTGIGFSLTRVAFDTPVTTTSPSAPTVGLSVIGKLCFEGDNSMVSVLYP